MATAAAVGKFDGTECAVCSETFCLPKILPCGHLLCRQCLVSWLQTQPEGTCPVCRYPVLDGQSASNDDAESIADSLPTHLFMAAIVEAEHLLSREHPCCVCDDVVSVALCMNCGDMFCQTCSKVHRKQSATKHHQVESLSTLTAEALAARRPTRCAVHAHELAQAYCPSHSLFICVLCATTDHRECQQVVQQEAKIEESWAVLADLTATLKAGKDDLDIALEQVEEDLKDLERQTDAGISEIDAVHQHLEKAVSEWYQRVKGSVLSTSAGLKNEKLDAKTRLVKEQGRFVTHSQIVQHFEGFSRHESFRNMTEMMKQRVDSLLSCTDIVASVGGNQTLTLTLDPQAVARIDQDLSRLGVTKTETSVKVKDSSEKLMRFHDNHGKDVQLSDDGLTAKRTNDNIENGVVISREPMATDRLYEVQIDAVNTTWNTTHVGVVACSPDTFQLPDCAMDSTSNRVCCVSNTKGRAFGRKLDHTWPALMDIKAGTHIGLALDSSRILHLFVNGKEQGLITSHAPEPCYFMFDLYSRCSKVTALSVKAVFGV